MSGLFKQVPVRWLGRVDGVLGVCGSFLPPTWLAVRTSDDGGTGTWTGPGFCRHAFPARWPGSGYVCPLQFISGLQIGAFFFQFIKHFVYIPYTYTYDIVLSYMCNISSISFLYLLLKCLRNTNEIFMNSCIQKITKYNPTFVIVSLDDLSAWIIKLFCERNN